MASGQLFADAKAEANNCLRDTNKSQYFVKAEFNNCYIIHIFFSRKTKTKTRSFSESSAKRAMADKTVRSTERLVRMSRILFVLKSYAHGHEGKTSARACIPARFLRIQESLSEKRKVPFLRVYKKFLWYTFVRGR